MFKSILNDCKILRVKTAQAAGTTDVVSDAVDTEGFEGCCFLAPVGAIVAGAVTSLHASQSATSGGTYADLKDSKVEIADDQDDKIAVLDIYRPRKRFLKATVKRATQNATVDGIIAILYNARVHKVDQLVAHVLGSKYLASPEEGTP